MRIIFITFSVIALILLAMTMIVARRKTSPIQPTPVTLPTDRRAIFNKSENTLNGLRLRPTVPYNRCCGVKGGWMPKVSTQVQRRIAELDAQYTWRGRLQRGAARGAGTGHQDCSAERGARNAELSWNAECGRRKELGTERSTGCGSDLVPQSAFSVTQASNGLSRHARRAALHHALDFGERHHARVAGRRHGERAVRRAALDGPLRPALGRAVRRSSPRRTSRRRPRGPRSRGVRGCGASRRTSPPAHAMAPQSFSDAVVALRSVVATTFRFG